MDLLCQAGLPIQAVLLAAEAEGRDLVLPFGPKVMFVWPQDLLLKVSEDL